MKTDIIYTCNAGKIASMYGTIKIRTCVSFRRFDRAGKYIFDAKFCDLKLVTSNGKNQAVYIIKAGGHARIINKIEITTFDDGKQMIDVHAQYFADTIPQAIARLKNEVIDFDEYAHTEIA